MSCNDSLLANAFTCFSLTEWAAVKCRMTTPTDAVHCVQVNIKKLHSVAEENFAQSHQQTLLFSVLWSLIFRKIAKYLLFFHWKKKTNFQPLRLNTTIHELHSIAVDFCAAEHSFRWRLKSNRSKESTPKQISMRTRIYVCCFSLQAFMLLHIYNAWWPRCDTPCERFTQNSWEMFIFRDWVEL